jgi:SAM-dependent methyltransferase
VTTPNEPQAEYWEERAQSWLDSEEQIEIVSGHFGSMTIDRLSPQPGEHVLDVGCGAGPTTIELATRTRPGGGAHGVDIAPSMVAAARRRAAAAGVEGASFAVADAQQGDLGRGVFDAAFSRFGVMFFADPVAAFTHLRGALSTEGRLAFVCWQDIFVNEWMLVPGSAVVSVTGALPPMPGPGEPGPFSLADPGRIEQVLTEAGFRRPEIDPVNHPVVLPESRVEALVALSARSGPVREALRLADDDLRRRILDAVRSAFGERIEHGELRLGAGAFIVTARS